MGINLLERRTVKASSSFSGKENAHYICLSKKFLCDQTIKKPGMVNECCCT